jgi:hypothetical protein
VPTNPYTAPTLTGYNSSPPPDDGTVSSANQVLYSTPKTKLTDPLSTYAQAISAAITSAFNKTINTDPAEANQVSGSLAFAESTLTIASGSVTATRSCHVIDTEGAAATDDLDTIAVGSVSDGCVLMIRPASAARVVTLKNGTGNLVIPGDIILNDTSRTTLLRRNGSNWNLVGTNLLEVLQKVITTVTTVVSSAAGNPIPYDDTIPQITEGTQLFSQAITPKNANSVLRHTVSFQMNPAGATTGGVALFNSGAAGAIFAVPWDGPGGDSIQMAFTFEESAASTTVRTYSLRFAASTADVVHVNADVAGNRRFGGVSRATYIIEELAPAASL